MVCAEDGNWGGSGSFPLGLPIVHFQVTCQDGF